MKPALSANGSNIGGSVYLCSGFRAEGRASGFKATGGVNLVGAKSGVNLECDGGQFFGQGKTPAFTADNAKIAGGFYFREGVLAEGTVRLRYANASSIQRRDVNAPEKATWDLRFTKVERLFNDEKSWPEKRNLLISGFVFDAFDDRVETSAEVQLGWLHRQPRDKFLSQPYEQLAAVLQRRGLEENARKVRIVKNKEHERHVRWRLRWLWYGFLGKAMGYGYCPWRALWISLCVIVFGWVVFAYAYNHDIITPSDEKAYVPGTRQLTELYPRFNAFVYSLEMFVPLLKLGMSQYWAPNATRSTPLPLCNQRLQITGGGLLRGYLWLHIIAGWGSYDALGWWAN
jgi:hypothetical protein